MQLFDKTPNGIAEAAGMAEQIWSANPLAERHSA